jgi:hypothetical protein
VEAWSDEMQGASPVMPSMFPPDKDAASQLRHWYILLAILFGLLCWVLLLFFFSSSSSSSSSSCYCSFAVLLARLRYFSLSFLTLSLRLFPHVQDTGGFFIAVLKKVAPCPTKADGKGRANKEKEKETKVEEIPKEELKMDVESRAEGIPEKNDVKANPKAINQSASDAQATDEEPKSAKRGGGGYPGAKGYEWKEDPFHPHTESLDDFYGLFGIDPTVRDVLSLFI